MVWAQVFIYAHTGAKAKKAAGIRTCSLLADPEYKSQAKPWQIYVRSLLLWHLLIFHCQRKSCGVGKIIPHAVGEHSKANKQTYGYIIPLQGSEELGPIIESITWSMRVDIKYGSNPLFKKNGSHRKSLEGRNVFRAVTGNNAWNRLENEWRKDTKAN